MTTVREKEQAQAQAEAERVQKKADAQARETQQTQEQRGQFGKLMKGDSAKKLAQHQSSARRQDGEQSSARLQNLARGLKQESVRNERLARQGTVEGHRALEQAKSLGGELDAKRAESEQAVRVQVDERHESAVVGRERVDERTRDVDEKQHTEKERKLEDAKAEAAMKRKPNAAIDAERGEKGSSGQDRSPDAAPIAPKSGAAPVDAPKAAHAPQKIPEEVLAALVKEVYVGVNEKGLSTFRVEMKDGALKGVAMEVTANGGKIALTFTGLDDNMKRLFRASEGDIMRRLGQKGLALDRLVCA
jgi:hypothetical protein